jgi:hypothetical protein
LIAKLNYRPKSLTIFLILVLSLQWKGYSADPPEARHNFPFAIVSVDSINMGSLNAGSSGQGSFTITNAGSYELLVSRVRSSCGLLVTTWPTQPLKPGEQGTITFRYDTSRPGPFERNIVVHTNAWQKNIVIPVKGEVLIKSGKP